MSVLTLPQSMVRDRENGIKANATHVDENFTALETAVNGKLDLDGTSVPTADIPMGGNKLTNVGSPALGGDAATKGYVDNADMLKADLASPTFTGEPKAPTVASVSDNSTKIATTEFVIDVLKAMYPVGTGVFMGTGATCPLAALFGTWELVASGKALWTGNGVNGGTTIAAGLPNITGTFCADVSLSGGGTGEDDTGALTREEVSYYLFSAENVRSHHFRHTLDASSLNPIYGNSTTVQPPAYVVNVWRRTA